MTPEAPSHTRKHLTLSARQRTTMRRLLIRDLSKCTTAALNSFERLGWIAGLSGGYQLTETGRRIAELSEKTPQGQDLELDPASVLGEVAEAR